MPSRTPGRIGAIIMSAEDEPEPDDPVVIRYEDYQTIRKRLDG